MGTIHWSSADRADLVAVATEVRRWVDYVPDSPLYRCLALGIADDPELLRVLARVDGVPPLNLLFGAVKLSLSGADALAEWYPHLTTSPREPGADAVAAFRRHVLAREDALVATASAHRTQTNETARAAVLLPFLPEVPFHAVDVGASAGLNLLLDRFQYRYSGTRPLGSGSVTIACENRGGFALPSAPPRLLSRTGIDLAPVDARDPAQAAWLEALVWPEHGDRLERLRAAIAVRQQVDVSMVAGDAATALAEVEAALPPGPMVVWHTIALYQAPVDVQRAIDAAVEEISSRRPVTRVGFEPVEDADDPQVRRGASFESAEVAARAHPHGRWIDQPG